MGELIVITDNKTNIYNLNENENHKDKCIEFMNDENINIDNSTKLTSYEISLLLAKQNIMTVHKENRNIIMYLPEKISLNQVKWFNDNIRLLFKYKVSAFNINSSNEIELIEDDIDITTSTINRIKKAIKKKERVGDNIEHRIG